MKSYSLLIAIILGVSSAGHAGEFSKIDQVVRETVVEAYSRDYDDGRLPMSEGDIWSLEIVKNNGVDKCLVVVSGYAKKPSAIGSSTWRFWICVSRNDQGAYEGELLDDEQIADE